MMQIEKECDSVMKQETMQALDNLKHLEQTLAAYNHAMGVIYLDASTAAPKGTYEGRGQTMGVLSKILYDLLASEKNGEILAVLEADMDALAPQDRREVEMLRKEYDQIHRIPADEYVAYNVLLNEAQMVWEKAKNENDFESFAPYLEKVVEYKRKFAGYYHPEMKPYDALLNEYEEGLNMQTLDTFFEQLRGTIVPLLAKIQNSKPVDDSFLYKHYPADKQRIFSDYLMDVLGLDRSYCGIAETEHPFTTGFNNKDIRITTHYYEDNVASSMYSVIHEGGHALYELGCDDCYNYTFLTGGVSMGIHESQSRFYENLIGRSEAFIQSIYPKMLELFPEQLAGVSANQFYRAVNKAEPSLIRTDADELSYCLHIMVRYELEKRMIEGTLKIGNVPAAWNTLYKEYLGIDVPSDQMGCLQDTHWAGGMIGYFPSYALGSAYGPQMLRCMEKAVGDIWTDVGKGDLNKVTGWLKENIHRHAGFYKPGTLFENVCGKFDPAFYTEYLTEKFTKLYDL